MRISSYILGTYLFSSKDGSHDPFFSCHIFFWKPNFEKRTKFCVRIYLRYLNTKFHWETSDKIEKIPNLNVVIYFVMNKLECTNHASKNHKTWKKWYTLIPICNVSCLPQRVLSLASLIMFQQFNLKHFWSFCIFFCNTAKLKIRFVQQNLVWFLTYPSEIYKIYNISYRSAMYNSGGSLVSELVQQNPLRSGKKNKRY